ncbi:hydrogenase 3 large subunit [Pectobacterium betavasculorum]|uniref:Hydrogenase 3 large subunit n=1 Tax=Pectobacterium betavasculorum TaxID=55207 RepID=A0A093UEG4_9GAMM|nr:hydrogenase large subunit [Pectobacterium betavasculorum]KFX06648.1 hydrogenase 3 large subunit [Pectobacterium betavasculorum]
MTYDNHVRAIQSDQKLGGNYLAQIRHKFPAVVLDEEWQTHDQLTITIKTESLPDVVEFIYYQLGGWLPVLFGNDERTLTGNYAVYYALSMEQGEKCWIVVKAYVDPLTLEFPSVTPRVPAAVWGEREIRDMYGLHPVGLPDERRLVLPDDWPDDLYPLRKDTMDYRQRPEPTTQTETYQFKNEGGSEARIVPVGPLHITSDEPGHFRLFVDGERIVDADYRLFYVHRGMEKLAETRMGYNEVTFLSDRVCGICGFAHSVAYTSSVENALGIYVPPRAHAIRSILLEVERLHSHLLNIGLSSHFTGFDTGFMQFFRVREKSMALAELLTGARKTYGLNLIGGIRRDILKEQRQKGIKLVQEMRAEVTQLVDMLLNTPNMEQRTQGIGLLDRNIARDYSPVGPMIRGSGFARDMRFDHDYAGYSSLPKTLFTLDGCDVFSRVMVRVKETLESLSMVEFGLAHLPEGPLLTEGFTYQPYKFALGYTEAPRGEDVHWSMLGDNQKLFRWRCRAATYANWPVLRYMLRGNTVSDAPLIIGSLDPCYSCTDRVTLVDIKKRKSTTVPYKEIERYSIERKNSPLK